MNESAFQVCGQYGLLANKIKISFNTRLIKVHIRKYFFFKFPKDELREIWGERSLRVNNKWIEQKNS